MFLNFPLDYQTDYWIEKAVALFGQLLVWHSVNQNHDNHARVLVKVWLMSDALVPRSFVMRQMGGHRRSWTVPVYLLRSDQWTAHMHDVPVDVEDPPPANGNPHPFHGPHVTTEHRFQQRLQIWLQQNGIFTGVNGGGANASSGSAESARQNSFTVRRVRTLPSRGQVNYQQILREHRALFTDGIEPIGNITAYSPLSAWNDMISENSSASDATLQIITGDHDIAESSAQGAARALAISGRQDDAEEIPPTFMIARSVLIHMQQPNLFINARSLKDAVFPSLNLIKTFFSTMHNVVKNVPDRRVARKLCFDDSPFMGSDLVSDASVIEYESRQDMAVVSVKRVRATHKNQAQITTTVRRSPRNNIYKGFKVNMPTDSRKMRSKVSARIIPDVTSTPSKDVLDTEEMDSPPVPPPTPIPVLQKIGVNICGIPAEELKKEHLEKPESDDEA
jgi:hypothetical protein